MGEAAGIKLAASALCVTLALTIAAPCAGRAKACSPQAAEAADAAIDNLDDWRKLQKAFTVYGQCDDGSIAEGYSEAIARLLVDKWNTLPTLAALAGRDRAFRQYVTHHINSTMDTNDLETIKRYSAFQCPPVAMALCQSLQRAAEDALR